MAARVEADELVELRLENERLRQQLEDEPATALFALLSGFRCAAVTPSSHLGGAGAGAVRCLTADGLETTAWFVRPWPEQRAN